MPPDALTPQQRLRTALARALVTQPDFLVLDEPLGSLDPRLREECWDDLRRIHVEAGVTILVFTDDPVEALALADRLAVMDLGRILQSGTPQVIVGKVHTETAKILRIPEVKSNFESQAFEVIGAGPEEFREFVRSEQRKYAQLVKAARIRVE